MDYVFATLNSAGASTYMSGLTNCTLLKTTTKYLFWVRTGLADADLSAMLNSGNIRVSASLEYLKSLA